MNLPRYFRVKYYSKFNLSDAKEIALFFGGKVISKNITSVSQKIIWKCKDGAKYTINELKQFAIKKKGRLLSKKYISTHTVYKWKCEQGHIWNAAWHSIRRGTWCRFCAHIITAQKNRKS